MDLDGWGAQLLARRRTATGETAETLDQALSGWWEWCLHHGHAWVRPRGLGGLFGTRCAHCRIPRRQAT